MNAVGQFFDSLALPWRILTFIVIAGVTHLLVLLIKRYAQRFAQGSYLRVRKLQSLTTLATSVVVFGLYFLMIGFILSEFGISLAGYLATASVVGLAVGFGSQGVVQDVVTGLTLIFSDLIDVGDLVEVSGQTGVVRGITMRFVELENALGGIVYIPNRTISSVINYPRGYVRCLVDVTLRGDAGQRERMQGAATKAMLAFHEQFPGLSTTGPSVEGRRQLGSGKEFLRLKFRIWPNTGGLVESTFREELTQTLRTIDPDYQSWMVAVSYEVEQRTFQPDTPVSWLLRPRSAQRERG
ncbi:MAG TPA: mechanosensitive ion channel domain-containing protein [Gammaproteobacteria bacterium]